MYYQTSAHAFLVVIKLHETKKHKDLQNIFQNDTEIEVCSRLLFVNKTHKKAQFFNSFQDYRKQESKQDEDSLCLNTSLVIFELCCALHCIARYQLF